MESRQGNSTRTEFVSCLNSFEFFVRSADKYARSRYMPVFDSITSLKFQNLSCQEFIFEYVWVVYASGFNTRVLSGLWGRLMSAYNAFVVLGDDSEQFRQDTWERVQKVFANRRKFDGIMTVCKRLGDWEKFKAEVLTGQMDDLMQLPFIGGVTKYHLARNLGIADVGKPDVHVVRLAKHFGFEDPHKFIEEAAKILQAPKGLADLAIWYYAADHGGTAFLEKANE